MRMIKASAAGLLALAAAACGQGGDTAQKGQAAPSAAAPAGYTVYATNETSGDLTVLDGASNQVIATIPLGKRPRGIRVSPDNRFLYIALSGSPMAGPGVDEDSLPPPDKSADGIGVFDIAQKKLVRVLKGVSDPEQSAVSKDGKLYVASEDTGQAVVIDIMSGGVDATIPVGGEPEGVAISPDGRWVYMTSEEDAQVAVIDTRQNKVAATIKVGARPRSVSFSPDGRRAYVSGENDRTVKVIDVSSHRVLNSVQLPGETMLPMDVIPSPDGRRIYVSTGRGGMVAALDAVSLSMQGSVKVGQRPWGIALSPDGRFLYTANGPSDDVSVVDTGTMAVVATVKVGTRPWGVATVPRAAGG